MDLTSTVGTVEVTLPTQPATLAYSQGILTITPTSTEVTEAITIAVTVGEETYTIEDINITSQTASYVAGTYEVTLTHPGTAIPSNTVDTTLNYGEELGVDENLFDVKLVKNDAGTITYPSASDIRLYPGGGNGSAIVITTKTIDGFEIKIDSINVTLNGTLGDNVSYKVNENTNLTQGGEYIINGNSVTIVNTTNATSGSANQVKIKSIVINYTITAANA